MLVYLRTLAGVGAVTIVCVAMIMEGNEGRWRRLLDGALWSTAGVAAARALWVGWGSATNPRPWDSTAFYTVARSAVVERSFYEPQILRDVFDTTNDYLPSDWLGEVGYWYPPPSILTIYPAGLFSAPTGLIVHHVLHGALLVLAIALLARWFPVVSGVRAYAAATIVVLSLQPTIDAIHLGQIAFGSLLSIVVAVRMAPSRPALAGLALGIGTLFKPLVLILTFLWTAVGRFRVLLGTIVALGLSSVVTAAMFGLDIYSDFMEFGPSDRSPELALNPVIQSLNGQMRRVLADSPDSPGAVASVVHLPTLAASIIILLATLFALRHAQAWASVADTIGLSVAASLLLYPNTLVSTLTLLAVPIALALHAAHEHRASRRLVPVVALGTIALTGGIVAPFFGLAFFWIASFVMILRGRPSIDRATPSAEREEEIVDRLGASTGASIPTDRVGRSRR